MTARTPAISPAVRVPIVMITAAAWGLAGLSYASYHLDCATLNAVAAKLTAGRRSPSEKVLTLNHWIHAHTPTAKNAGYFLLPSFGATPVQVLRHGGDCADKSRLLSAMLRAAGIPATMAMCFDPRTGRPSHTVVEARLAPGRYMLVDPAFDLAYPKPDGTGHYDLLDLRRRPHLLFERLDRLQQALPRPHPVRAYNRTLAVYDDAATINWNKNALTKWLGDLLRARLGADVYRLPRPLILEEPKLFVAALAATIGAVCIVGTAVLAVFARCRSRAFTARIQPQAPVGAAACPSGTAS